MANRSSERVTLTLEQWVAVALNVAFYLEATGCTKKSYYETEFATFVRKSFNLQGSLPSLQYFYNRISVAEKQIAQSNEALTNQNAEACPEPMEQPQQEEVTPDQPFGFIVNPDQKIRIIHPITPDGDSKVLPHDCSPKSDRTPPAPRRKACSRQAQQSAMLKQVTVGQGCALVGAAVRRAVFGLAAHATKSISDTLLRFAN